jgi:hypothetical protein
MKFIRPGCFVASIDITDSYYSIPVAEEDRKFLMFEPKGPFTNSLVSLMSFLVPLGLLQKS